MNTPTILSIVALFGFGFTNFFWQLATPSKPYEPSFLMIQSLTFAVVMVTIHAIQKHPFMLSTKVAGLAGVAGICASVAAVTTFLALSLGGEGSRIFPIVGLNLVVSTVLSLIIFREPITAPKLVGLGFGVTSIILLAR
jgi:uncharacterized membrane protein